MKKLVLYVSGEGNNSWTGTLPKPNEDNSDGPFPDLFTAMEKLKMLRLEGRLGDAEVKIKGGTYRLNEPLRFSPPDSGKITYMPYDGEKVIFKGTKQIKGFYETEVNGVAAWAAYIPEVKTGEWYFRSLFINGKPGKRPIFPRNRKLKMSDVPGHSISNDGENEHSALFDGAFGFKVDEDLPENMKNIVDVDVLIFHYWLEERMPIISYNKDSKMIICDRRSIFKIRDDVNDKYPEFVLENVFEGLKDPGEWYLDRTEGKLYYIPESGETIENTVIEAPVINELLLIEGDPRSGNYVENLTFKNLDFDGSDWEHIGCMPERMAHMYFRQDIKYANSPQAAFSVPAAVKMTGCRYCTFCDCSVKNVGYYGFDISYGSFYNTIEDCEILNCGGGGIKITGGDTQSERWKETACNTIYNNLIKNCTRVFYSAVGIGIFDSHGNSAAHNEISDLQYTGISCGWVWGYGESNSHHNVMEYNHIHHLGSGLLSDMGGIYCLGEQSGTVIRGNRIHDIKNANYGGWGIYTDEGSSFILVEKNVVYNTSCEPYFQHYGRQNTIRYNVFALPAGKNMGIVSIGRSMNDFSALFYKNILINKNEYIYDFGYGFQLKHGELCTDGNIIFIANGRKPVARFDNINAAEKTIEWDKWIEEGLDGGSVFGDFKEVCADTFVFGKDSYACQNGFPADVDMKSAGRYIDE